MAASGSRLVLLASLVSPCVVLAQGGVPLGPEFRVNTYTPGNQMIADVAADSAGNFVVTWTSPSQDGVFAQRYTSMGVPLGGEFRVNAQTAGIQFASSVASDPAGNFVIAWTGFDSAGLGVFARRYANAGSPLGGEFRVNTYTTSHQVLPAVTSDSAGNFVIAWQSAGQDGSDDGIFAQRFASTGVALGEEFQVNTDETYGTFGNQRRPSVAADSAGNFVVAWENGTCCADIWARRYASTGAPLGAEFKVSTEPFDSKQDYAAVAADPAGNFVVAWMSHYSYLGVSVDVKARRYSSTGVPQGGAFRVNTFTNGVVVGDVSVASDSGGNFVVVWTRTESLASDAVSGQRFASTGAPLGGEFRVNTFTDSEKHYPAVDCNPAGNFVVVWQSDDQDGSDAGVFGQRYSLIVPVELQSFGVE